MCGDKGFLSPPGGCVGPGMADDLGILFTYYHLPCVPQMEKAQEACLSLSVESAAFYTLEKWKTSLKAPLEERASDYSVMTGNTSPVCATAPWHFLLSTIKHTP